MEMRTTFDIPHFSPSITHRHEILAVGSCFANMVGQRLLDRKYPALVNPFGVIFNPVSLFTLLKNALVKKELPDSLYLEFQERFLHFQCHSEVAASSQKELQKLISQKSEATLKHLEKASHIFITLGTSFIYEHTATGEIVANCHKQPSKLFTKELSSIEEMAESFTSFYETLQNINPDIQVILTVSPVRHTKDGIPENQLSKSQLLVLCHLMAKIYPFVNYFPSYELMMDDLRDYRFYGNDMVHPSQLAEDYIWEKFTHSFIGDTDARIDRQIESIHRSLAHKPFNPYSTAHREFLEKLLHTVEQMPAHLDFTTEKELIHNQLAANEDR
jgi:hypothetical protein